MIALFFRHAILHGSACHLQQVHPNTTKDSKPWASIIIWDQLCLVKAAEQLSPLVTLCLGAVHPDKPHGCGITPLVSSRQTWCQQPGWFGYGGIIVHVPHAVLCSAVHAENNSVWLLLCQHRRQFCCHAMSTVPERMMWCYIYDDHRGSMCCSCIICNMRISNNPKINVASAATLTLSVSTPPIIRILVTT